MTSDRSQSTAVPKPFLPPTETGRFFWDAAKEHRLVVQRCDECGYYVHWPQLLCPHCHSERLSPAEVSGKGTVYSFTIVHHVFHPGFASDVPYSLAIIELEEQPGLRLLANVVDCPNDALYIGMPVEVTFEDRDGYTLPQFRPAVEARR
jgi:uncharacterized OB-fold protein